MGEIADMLIQQGLDALAVGEIDEWYFTVRCKFCGNDGYHWQKTEGGWRLFTETGKLHSCKAHCTRSHL